MALGIRLPKEEEFVGTKFEIMDADFTEYAQMFSISTGASIVYAEAYVGENSDITLMYYPFIRKDKPVRMEFRVVLNYVGVGGTAFLIYGDPSDVYSMPFFGFKAQDGVLYGAVYNGTNEETIKLYDIGENGMWVDLSLYFQPEKSCYFKARSYQADTAELSVVSDYTEVEKVISKNVPPLEVNFIVLKSIGPASFRVQRIYWEQKF